MIVATNLTDLHREASFVSEMLLQVLNGMTLEVLEEQDKWCRVRANDGFSDGYEGWAHKPYLQNAAPSSPTHMVSALVTKIHTEPEITSAKTSCLLGGTTVSVAESTAGWSLVRPAGTMIAEGWIQNGALRARTSFPVPSNIARRQIIDDARRFTGVYYLWGGNTGFGTDCSGLAWLTHRMAGYTLPRDAHPQFHCGKPVTEPWQAGDLLFFRSEKDPNRIGHVGISVGGWDMIHSSRSRNGVYEENVQSNPDLISKFAGARTFL